MWAWICDYIWERRWCNGEHTGLECKRRGFDSCSRRIIFHFHHPPQHMYYTTVIVCTDLSGKESHRQVGMGRVITSRSLGSVMVRTLSRNARDVGSNPALCASFPICFTLWHMYYQIPDEGAATSGTCFKYLIWQGTRGGHGACRWPSRLVVLVVLLTARLRLSTYILSNFL